MSNYGLIGRSPSKTVRPDFIHAVALGLVPGWRAVSKYGRHPTMGASEEDVWTEGGVIVRPSVAAQVSFVSSDNDDAAGDTGLRTILVQGLDASYNEVEEIVTLTGTTPALTVGSFLRLNYLQGLSAGASGWNEGVITASIGGNVQGSVEATQVASHDSHYTVPLGHTVYPIEATAWQVKDTGSQSGFRLQPPGLPMIKPAEFLVYQAEVNINLSLVFPVPAMTDIKVVSSRIGAGGSYDHSIFYRFLLANDSFPI